MISFLRSWKHIKIFHAQRKIEKKVVYSTLWATSFEIKLVIIVLPFGSIFSWFINLHQSTSISLMLANVLQLLDKYLWIIEMGSYDFSEKWRFSFISLNPLDWDYLKLSEHNEKKFQIEWSRQRIRAMLDAQVICASFDWVHKSSCRVWDF